MCYNATGYFHCPVADELIKAEREKAKAENKDDRFSDLKVVGSYGEHTQHYGIGDYVNKTLDRKEEFSEEYNANIVTLKSVRYRVDRKHLPVCKCGQEMKWVGYPVWYEFVDPKAKLVMGLFRNNPKDKQYWMRYFKSRKARDKFIANFLAKHRK